MYDTIYLIYRILMLQAGMQIFVEHWGEICNFTPILPYF